MSYSIAMTETFESGKSKKPGMGEQGEELERDAPIQEVDSKNLELSKREVLKKLQGLNEIRVTGRDKWGWDGTYEDGSDKEYEASFHDLLKELGYTSFTELVKERRDALKRPVSALDLFGGAYFLPDLENISTIVGVRLGNMDHDYAQRSPVVSNLRDDSRRKIIERNLYAGKTWKALSKELQEKGLDGFDVITCRPQAPFGYTKGIYAQSANDIVEEKTYFTEEIYVALLNRALSLMNPDGGLFFLQKPVLNTDEKTEEEFWKKYLEDKEKEGYEFIFDKGTPVSSSYLLVKRNVLQE